MIFGIAPFSTNPFSTTAETRFVIASVSATSSAGSVTVVAEANLGLTGVAGTGSIGLSVVTAKSVTLSASVSATASIGLTIVAANANVVPSGVDSQGNIGTTTVLAEANLSLTSPALIMSGATGTNVQAKAVVLPVGVAANTNAGILTTKTSNVFEITGVPLNAFAGNFNVTTVQFDYESLKASFDRNRVIFIAPTNQGFTINVPADPNNRTILIEAMDTDRVVRIAA
tara:strand:- start:1167 stop:1850 length:684 start_codon:yes stop_codon:yes gene_type:complete